MDKFFPFLQIVGWVTSLPSDSPACASEICFDDKAGSSAGTQPAFPKY